MSNQIGIEDRQFQRAFESFEIPPEKFDHPAHVRLAYIYLCQLPVEGATQQMKRSLLAFLSHLGVDPSKFHETITGAWIMAVAHFMANSTGHADAASFMSANPRLLDSKIMLSHYSAQVLFSPQARQGFVEPDIEQIPRHG